MMTTLPAHRVLYASGTFDLPGDPAPLFAGRADADVLLQPLVDAIHSGKQTRLSTNRDELNLIEVCMTEIRDPGTGELRYAVEMWNDAAGHEMAKHDFAVHADASARYHHYHDRLRLAELAV